MPILVMKIKMCQIIATTPNEDKILQFMKQNHNYYSGLNEKYPKSSKEETY